MSHSYQISFGFLKLDLKLDWGLSDHETRINANIISPSFNKNKKIVRISMKKMYYLNQNKKVILLYSSFLRKFFI
jgi:hypothetical protein